MLSVPSDILSKGTWTSLQDLEDPALKELAKKLPDTIIASWAGTTAKKYMGAFRRWKDWARQYGMETIPAKDFEFALYLQHLADCSRYRAAVEEACNAIAWVHTMAGLSAPTASPFVCATKDGLQRSLAKPVVKKAPVTVDMLAAIVRDARTSGKLADLRLATACLLAFAGFLHFSELASLRPCDIVVNREMLTIHIACSKTDQYRKGHEVVISRTDSLTCPVAMLEAYMERTGMQWLEQGLLFRVIQHSKSGESLRKSGGISYSCLKEQFKKKLEQLGYNPKE